ncbi:hypothetical protein TRFO_30140 [Tritrichomonas foetus]|uniref:Uncharacterized protein n=1 Tax=Tritrichomonas foetus TaxID=1144522 RepID=A0A1J4JW80_9EUKA|nr:hypothetical protein TRFO_30140 [Tritrichomonas foetus]|eukprot:OHT02696.1 hypothetical protein TRFO_30140 [Tritrichomonas foetus]
MQIQKREHLARALESSVNATSLCSSPRLSLLCAQFGVAPIDELLASLNLPFQVTLDEAVAACRYSFALSQYLVEMTPTGTPAIVLNYKVCSNSLTVARVPQTITPEKLKLFASQLTGAKAVKVNLIKKSNINNSNNGQKNFISGNTFKLDFEQPEQAHAFWRALKYAPIDGHFLLATASWEPIKYNYSQTQIGMTTSQQSNNSRNTKSKNNNNYNNNNKQSGRRRNASVNNNHNTYVNNNNINNGGRRQIQVQPPTQPALKISRRRDYMQVVPLLIENRLNINVSK